MASVRVAILSGCTMLCAAVNAVLPSDRFFMGQVDAAMGACHHFGGLGCFGCSVGLGWVDRPTSLEGPDDHQDHQQ